MRKFLRSIAIVLLFGAWCVGLMAIAMPEQMQEMRISLADMFNAYAIPYSDDSAHTILDARIPLAGPPWASVVEHNGWLRVREGQLVNEDNEPVQLRGMSSHGLAWFPQYTSFDAIKTTRDYGANMFRVAMYVDDMYGNYAYSDEAAQQNKAAMYEAIDSALALDMYVIADWHVRTEGNPLYRLDSAIAFFDELSQRYADTPGVLYEISSDPNGDTTWDDIYEYADHVIPVIRQNAPNAIVIAGTLEYSSDLTATLRKPIPYDNTLYAYHYISGVHKSSYRTMLEATAKAGLPIITTWALGGGDTPIEQSERYAMDFVSYVQDNGISWAGWSLANKDEPCAAIRPEVTALSGWTVDDLTNSGKIAFAALQN